ncbi:hypothetical protein ACYCFC_10030 [Stutzerimonas sp. NM35]
MSNSAINFWSGAAWVMAFINAIASIAAMIAFGTAEIDVGRYVPITESTVVWPVILGGTASAVYGFLFAALMSIARIAAINSRTALELRIKQKSD